MALARSTLLVTPTQIYRDCVKVAYRMATDPNRNAALRALIKSEFNKNRFESDQEKIEELRTK